MQVSIRNLSVAQAVNLINPSDQRERKKKVCRACLAYHALTSFSEDRSRDPFGSEVLRMYPSTAGSPQHKEGQRDWPELAANYPTTKDWNRGREATLYRWYLVLSKDSNHSLPPPALTRP